MKRRIIWTVGIVVTIAIGGIWFVNWLSGFMDPCAYSEGSHVMSPDGKYEAIDVTGGCGATDETGMQWITIVNGSDAGDLEHSQRVLDFDSEIYDVKLVWTGPRDLSVVYSDPPPEPVPAKVLWHDVIVRFHKDPSAKKS